MFLEPVTSQEVIRTIPTNQDSQPLDVVFRLLGNELDAFQDIGDVIDASLLHLQNLRGPVEVDHAIRGLGQQVQEALGGQVERRVIAGLLCSGLGDWGGKKEGEQKGRRGGKQVEMGTITVNDQLAL